MVDWDCTAKLHMGNYMHRKASQEDSLYDLYAVVNHDGNLNGGHYTSFAKNQLDGQWLKFDDEHCTWVDSPNVVTSKAFILYFVRNAEVTGFGFKELRK